MPATRSSTRADQHSAHLGELARLLRERGVPNLVSKRITLKVHTTAYGPRSSVTYDSPELDVWTTDGTPVAIITVDDGQKELAYSVRPLGEAPQPLCPVAAPAEGADIVAAMVRMANNGNP
ncbi:MAG: hypothetical protein JWQ95_7163 [Sphaerisporangium sp.]|nr:hypothetical protein [Sphaerisporangium sp.]